MEIYAIFWTILGLGVAIPCTLLLIFNLFTKAIAGDNYQLDLKKVSILYIIGLLGWAITFGIG